MKKVTTSRIDTVDATLDDVREATRPGAPDGMALALTYDTRQAINVLLDRGLSEIRDAIGRRDNPPPPPADAPQTATDEDHGGADDPS